MKLALKNHILDLKSKIFVLPQIFFFFSCSSAVKNPMLGQAAFFPALLQQPLTIAVEWSASKGTKSKTSSHNRFIDQCVSKGVFYSVVGDGRVDFVSLHPSEKCAAQLVVPNFKSEKCIEVTPCTQKKGNFWFGYFS